MYSDSDYGIDVSSDATSVDGMAIDVDEMVEMAVESHHTMMQAYGHVFEFDDAPFQRAVGRSCSVRDDALLAIPPMMVVKEDEELQLPTSGSPALDVEEEIELTQHETTRELAPSSDDLRAALTWPNGRVRYNTTALFRFFVQHFHDCLLIPIEPDTYRSSLRRQHKTLRDVAGVPADFRIGHREGQHTGWALVLTMDDAVLDALRACYPGHRHPQLDDIETFFRSDEVHHHDDGAAPSPTMGVPQNPSDNNNNRRALRALHTRMQSQVELLECVEAAGGWPQVRLVAFDAEAFLMEKGGQVMPAEYAFCPITSSLTMQHATTSTNNNNNSPALEFSGPLPLGAVRGDHFFTHPGEIGSAQLHQVVYTCTQLHGIPFCNASFLRQDYNVLADHCALRYLNDPHTIILCKGADKSAPILDYVSLLWLLYAGAYIASPSSSTPPTNTLHAPFTNVVPAHPFPWMRLRCFNVATFKRAAESSGLVASNKPVKGEAKNNTTTTTSSSLPCWYHHKLSQVTPERYHCAWRDAEVLKKDVEDFLQTQ